MNDVEPTVISDAGRAGAAAHRRDPVRVLHVMWNMEIGGAERALFQLVREQRAQGIVADVVVGSRAGYYGRLTRDLGAEVHELGQRHTYDLSMAARARSVAREYSAVHFHSAELGLMHVLSRVPGLARVYTHRAGMFTYRWKQRLRYRIAGYYLRRCFHGFSGNTRQACDSAAALFGIARERFSVTYNGIDFSLLAPHRSRSAMLAELNETGDNIRVGTCANLRTLKRIDLLIEAVARANDRRLRCYIVGEGPALAALEARAAALGVADRVLFTGKKENIGDYLQLFDIFVLPSGPEESFGNAAVEAMGMGLPTIVFADGGGLVEHIEDGVTGRLVRDVAELAGALDHLAGSAADRSRLGEAAKAAMRERYNPARMAERYLELYRGALSRAAK